MDLRVINKIKFWLIATAVLAIIGQFLPTRIIRILIMASYFAMFAMAWDLIAGYTGYIFFAPHGIIGLAAYMSVLCSYTGFARGGFLEGFGLSWPIYITMPIGIIVATSIGFLIFLPSLKLRGNYFCLFSLAFILALDGIIITSPITGGTRGLFGFPQVMRGELPNLYLSLVLMMVTGIMLSLIGESHIGKILKAIYMNEDLVNASGINANKYKFLAFSLSLITLSVGGVFYIHYLGSLSPESVFGVSVIVNIIVATIIGGIGTITGPMIGAYILLFLSEGLRTIIPHTPTRFIIYGIIGILIYTLKPSGLYGTIKKLLTRA
ncbi:branched-chain amino acid ABC transporter permease [Candidatus Bathyarchaeota archaeon]|nr:branched-chain amino acid ABC transporter permease [Candidatus Bathyarchaeota archaeon]